MPATRRPAVAQGDEPGSALEIPVAQGGRDAGGPGAGPDPWETGPVHLPAGRRDPGATQAGGVQRGGATGGPGLFGAPHAVDRYQAAGVELAGRQIDFSRVT